MIRDLSSRFRLAGVTAKAALLGLLIGCSTVPETGRSQFTIYSNEALAPAAAQQFSQMRQELPVSQNTQDKAMLTRVGRRVVEAARGRGADIAPPDEWEFVLFADEQYNAFAMPGGKVGFYEGILTLMDNEAQVAAVMAHEVAHVVANHGGERVSQQLGVSAIGAGLAIGLGQSEMDGSLQQAIVMAYGVGSQMGVLAYSRTHESEADEIGLIYMAEAGYDPREAVTFWENMAAASGSNAPPEFLSTHPSHGTRIQDLQAQLPRALEIYRAQGGQ